MSQAWERLWAPHRIEYIQAGTEPHKIDCPFCRIPQGDDVSGLVVARGSAAYVVMNLYPYNTGHLLICPVRHYGDYTDATSEEVAEIGHLTQTAMKVLREVTGCHGFNIGMNQGERAGAGIAGHLHQHVVPRWSGDANFMPVIGGTKVMPQLLSDSRQLLADAWPHA
jgi:ATP adenylyltransferase